MDSAAWKSGKFLVYCMSVTATNNLIKEKMKVTAPVW
jgi:hypothetical protein